MNLMSPKTKKELLQDNYTNVEFHYLKFQKLIEDCFLLGKDCQEEGTWKTLMGLYNTSTTSTNAIHSVESFSSVPSDPYTVQRFQSLQKLFRIHVIVVYRPVHEWLPSQYSQNEKGKFFKSRSGRYKGWSGTPDRSSFVDFFETYFPRMQDSLHVRNKYVHFFGEDAVTVMPMQKDAELLTEFYCRALPNANNTCLMSRQIGKKKRRNGGGGANPSSLFLFDHDRLLVAARHLIPKNMKRHDATVALKRRLTDLNLTAHDMPQECLSPTQEDALWNYTLQAEMKIAPAPLTKEELRQAFIAYRPKFCSVNVTATLQNETWRDVIASIVPKNID